MIEQRYLGLKHLFCPKKLKYAVFLQFFEIQLARPKFWNIYVLRQKKSKSPWPILWKSWRNIIKVNWNPYPLLSTYYLKTNIYIPNKWILATIFKHNFWKSLMKVFKCEYIYFLNFMSLVNIPDMKITLVGNKYFYQQEWYTFCWLPRKFYLTDLNSHN